MAFRVGFEATALHGQRSGVGTYTLQLLRAMLESAPPDWTFYAYSNRSLAGLQSDIERAVLAPHGRFAPSRWLWVQLRLAALARREECTVMHCPNGMGPLWSTTPLVLTIHDLSLIRYPEYHPRRRIPSRTLLPRLARRAAAVIAVSEFTRGEILRVLGLPGDKVHTVHAAAAECFQPVTDPARMAAVRDKYGLPPRFVLYVGAVEPRKNLHRLLRAFRDVRQREFPHQLILAGPPGWMMDDFAHERSRLGLDGVVRLLGYVPADDMPALYSLAELFVYPSLYEGFGLPTLEAMACGTPVLSSNGSALAEVCGDSSRLVDPENEEELAEAMAILLGDADLRADLSRKGLQRARDFSWRRAAKETMAVYARAAKNPGTL